jgi:hypothetical protein
MSALSVVTAIALGGPGSESPPEGPVSEPAPQKGAPDPAPKKADPKPEPTTKPRLQGSTFRREEKVEVGAGTLRFDRAYSYTLAAGAEFGLIPSLVLPRYEFTASVANFVTTPAGSSHIVGPVLQVGWSFLGPGTYANGEFSTHVYGLQAGVKPCSAISYDSQGMVLLICSEFSVGAMALETKDADGKVVQSKEAGFGTAGLGLDAQYNLSSLLHVGLRLGGRMQFGGISAERPDHSEIFKAPLFGGYAVAGLGLHF